MTVHAAPHPAARSTPDAVAGPRRRHPLCGVSLTARGRALLGLLALVAAPLTAQSTGRLTGVVYDRSTGAPVVEATVVFLGDGRSTTTDSAGAFRFERLPMGVLRFLVRAKGFPSAGLMLPFAKGEAMERRVELDSSAAAAATLPPRPPAGGAAGSAVSASSSAQALPTVAVAAEASRGPRYANFERRRRTGSGQYVVAEEIEKGGFNSLQDIARTLRGVTVSCSGGMGCQIQMTRAPMRCKPEYIVDDNVDNEFGPSVAVRDIEALEFYTGASDVPGEYAGRNAGCGVVVIWTKSGPPRRKKL